MNGKIASTLSHHSAHLFLIVKYLQEDGASRSVYSASLVPRRLIIGSNCRSVSEAADGSRHRHPGAKLGFLGPPRSFPFVAVAERDSERISLLS